MSWPYDFDTRGIRALPHRLRLNGLLERLGRHDFSSGSYADVGCGDGYVTTQVMQVTHARSCDGLDFDSTLLESGEKAFADIRFIQCNLNTGVNLPTQYDFVTCFETLEHVTNLTVAVKNLLSLTKPGGLLILTVPIEVGFIGTTKFLAKTVLWQDRLTEAFSPYPGMHRQYLKALVLDHGISQFREQGNTLGYWPGHWGFDYRKIELLFKGLGAQVKSERFLTTRYFEVRP
jgi:2-polyprenyl-3-methyl-5-hydroxy-6-metoxy-1,4-benzoquinol methylase